MANPSAGTPPGANARPRSPHLQVYRWPITMLTSILHRASGVANAGGLVVVTVWLVAAAMGPEPFGMVTGLLSSLIGRLVLFGMTLSAVYHLFNGVRHLAWDTGAGFELGTSAMTAYLVFALTIVTSVIIWIAAYWMMGAFA